LTLPVAAVVARLAPPATLATAIVPTFFAVATSEALVATLPRTGTIETFPTFTANAITSIRATRLTITVGNARTIGAAHLGARGGTNGVPGIGGAILVLADDTRLAAATAAARLCTGETTTGDPFDTLRTIAVQPGLANSASTATPISTAHLAFATRLAALPLEGADGPLPITLTATALAAVISTLLAKTIWGTDLSAADGIVARRISPALRFAIVVAFLRIPSAVGLATTVLLMQLTILAPLDRHTLATPFPANTVATPFADVRAGDTNIIATVVEAYALFVTEALEGRLAAARTNARLQDALVGHTLGPTRTLAARTATAIGTALLAIAIGLAINTFPGNAIIGPITYSAKPSAAIGTALLTITRGCTAVELGANLAIRTLAAGNTTILAALQPFAGGLSRAR